MARQQGQGPRQPIKGFRPGKEPPRLRQQQARQQLGEMGAAQEKLVELFADRSPAEARKLIGRWTTGTLVMALVLAALAGALLTWSLVAGLVVAALAVVALVLWWRLRGQRAALESLAEMVGGGRGGGKRKR